MSAMAKTGLAALADGYGLERGEADHCKQLGERFFEQLGDCFTPLVARRVQPIGSAGLVIEKFADFCTALPSQQTVVLGWPGQTALAFRIDYQSVLALVEGVLGRSNAEEPGTLSASTETTPRLTPTEARIVSNLLKHGLCAVTPQVLGGFIAEAAAPPTVRIGDGAGLVPDTLDAAEMMVAVNGQLAVSGRSGAIALGLTLASVVARRARTPATAEAATAADGVERARATLAGAQIPVAAVLGSVKLPLNTIEELRCGSIIPLGQLRAGAPKVELRTGEHTLRVGTVIAERGWYRFLVRSGEDSSERADNGI